MICGNWQLPRKPVRTRSGEEQKEVDYQLLPGNTCVGGKYLFTLSWRGEREPRLGVLTAWNWLTHELAYVRRCYSPLQKATTHARLQTTQYSDSFVIVVGHLFVDQDHVMIAESLVLTNMTSISSFW